MDVELFSKKARLVGPLKKVRTREEVDFQWVRSALSVGLPMSFFDNKEVRKTVLMTVECAENYIRTKPGGVKETTLSHHTFFTPKLIPKLDKFIDNKNMGKVREMTHDLTVAVFSDGCGTNPSFVIVLILLLRWSPGFPANKSHSLDPSANRSHSITNRIHSLTLKVVLLPCSASVIEDWIHSKRKNRLGQDLVERLVCAHTNLKLEQRLEVYETGLLPWDIKMTVEGSLSDDEDGVPHSVSYFESESESEKDSD